MDDYPPDYVDHNLPLILLSGLGPEPENEDDDDATPPSQEQYPLLHENPVQIFSDFPLLTDSTACALLDELRSQDASDASWNGKRDKEQSWGPRFKVKRVGRTYNLPPRKAQAPPISPSYENDTSDSSSLVLHSPISPLSPGSPTFPDGIMTQFWVAKHQDLVPAAFVNFLPFTTDYNMASLRDNQLKIEINTLRKDWASSGYKTRFVVVLLCEDGPQPDDANERLSGIRRATNLDPKSMFVLRPNPSEAEISEFARSLLSSLQSPCAEYYRDLSKHARRKRNRGSIPPPTLPPTTGTSQTLSIQGWNIRYEFKLGVFAEFRQEMDAAYRNYETAYSFLFGEEVIEIIAGWSSRFGDARMLADALAIRMIRCLLWMDQTTSAARVWLSHQRRIQDIISRRGKGTRNYGWEAWEARWFQVMAELMGKAEILMLPFGDISLAEASASIYATPEKAIPFGERMAPWEMLHHAGYWLNQAAQHTARRRALAEDIPEEDRVSPSQSSAHQLTSRSNVYDTYLCPEPHLECPLPGKSGTNHSEIMLGHLRPALKEFSQRHQTRMVEQLTLEIANELMRLELWDEAFSVLQPVWDTLSWRRNGWWDLMAHFGSTLRKCAVRAQDSETILRVDWELMNRRFPVYPELKYDFNQSLEGLSVEKPKAAVALQAGDAVSCITPSFVFAKAEGNVGEPLQCQLVLTSHAHQESAHISLTEVKAVFEGSLRPIRILPDDESTTDTEGKAEVVALPLQDSGEDRLSIQSPSALPSMVGHANLTFAPSQTKAFNLTSIPREAGEVRLASLTLILEEESFSITYISTEQSQQQQPVWWGPGKGGIVPRNIGKDRDTSVSRILPKPPKVHITTPKLRENYYTDEQVTLDVQLENQEDEAAEVSVEMRLIGQSELPVRFSWIGDTEPDGSDEDDDDDPEKSASASSSSTEKAASSDRVERRKVGVLAPGASSTLPVAFTDTSHPADYEVEITVSYHLVSDVETPIFKTITFDLSFIRPFEANYELLPRVHPEQWPDFFHWDDISRDDETETEAKDCRGLKQRWNLSSSMVSFALEPLVVEEIKLVVLSASGGVVRDVGAEVRRHISESSVILPEEHRESDFLVEVQRLTLEDRQPASLNLGLDVRWRRYDSDDDNDDESNESASPSPSNNTLLPVPRFVIPMGEPRVLATKTPSATTTALPGFIHLDYTLENPSVHFLTFNVTMEANDQLAFSGPKSQAVQLAPVSRHTIRYNLLCTASAGKWVQPQLTVVDSYFNKTLRVLPTEGMRADKKGILVSVDN